MRYRVEVTWMYELEVEAESYDEAEQKALEEARYMMRYADSFLVVHPAELID